MKIDQQTAAEMLAFYVPMTGLWINSAKDIMERKILPGMTLALGAGGTLMRRMLLGETGPELFWSMLPGIFMLAAALGTKGKCGGGDALILLFLGAWEDAWELFGIMVWALVTAGICGLICLACRKRKVKIPFVPFLFGAWCIFRIGGILR